MQDFYQMPFEPFERHSPYGTPEDVAEFLHPYIEAGCSAFNVIPCGATTRPRLPRSASFEHCSGIHGDSDDGIVEHRGAETLEVGDVFSGRLGYGRGTQARL